MTDPQHRVRISKFLSLVLRHEPQRLGLQLAPGGWVPIDALLAGAARHGFPIGRDEVAEVVATNDKHRFAMDRTGTLIRANQGHSVAVDLELEPVEPPRRLYHGTAERTVPRIRRDGLRKMARHHVHLSPDRETAVRVGTRHGRPVVLTIDAGSMHRGGQRFYRSENGVWLTDAVAPQFIISWE